MGDDEAFTEWLEQSNQDAEFRSVIYKLMDNHEKVKKTLNLIEKNQYENGEPLKIEGMQSIACNTLDEIGYYD